MSTAIYLTRLLSFQNKRYFRRQTILIYETNQEGCTWLVINPHIRPDITLRVYQSPQVDTWPDIIMRVDN